MRRSLASALLVAIVLCMTGAGTSHAQTLDSELSGLLKSHPDVRARERQAQAAEHGIDRAFAGYLPKFDIYGQTGPQYIDSPVLESAGGGTWVSVAQVAGARITENLFNGFATPSQVRSARLNLEVAEFALAGTRQNTLFDGIDAYLEVLRQNRLLSLARDSERTIMQQLNLEDERVQRGAGIAVDVLQAKSRLQIAKERRVGYEGGLADAVARYVQVFDHAPEIGGMSQPKPPLDLLPRTLEEALQVARQENPAIDASLASVAVADERKRLARSEYYPSVDLVAQASRENDNDLVQGTRTDMSVLLSASWNLFNGNATTAAVRQASAEFKASRDGHQSVARKVDQQTRLAWNELETARQRVELLENAVAIASEVFDARQKLREAGRETVINVLDAENEVYNAKINLISAEGDARLAVYRLLQGMGRLGPVELGLDTN